MDDRRILFDKRISRFLLLVAVLAIIAIMMLEVPFNAKGSQNITGPRRAVRIWLNGDVVGAHPGWNDSAPGPTMTIVSGITVNLFLNSTDILAHRWFIDSLQNGQPDPNGISSPDFSRSTTGVLNFTFTPVIGQNIPAAGNWTYKCYYHPSSMYGMIRVVPPAFSLSASPSYLTTTVGRTTTSRITVSSQPSFKGNVNLSATGPSDLLATITPQTINGGSGTATLTVTAQNAGNYTTTVTGTNGTLIQSLNVTVKVEDFTITADPTIVPAQVNTQSMSTITVRPINHFDGTVNLTLNSTQCTLSQSSLTSMGVSSLSCTFTSPGPFEVQVTATNSSLSHTVMITFDVAVPDYIVVATPTTTTALADQTENSTITILSINGFSDRVTLSFNSPPSGLTCNLNPIIITPNPRGASTLSCKGIAGNYTLMITATSGNTARSATLLFSIQDFAITGSSTTLNVSVGQEGVSTIAILPINQFGEPVVFTTSDPNCNVTPPQATTSSNVTLRCTFSIPGKFHITLRGESGSVSHYFTIDYIVTNTQASGVFPGWLTTTAVVTTAILGVSGLAYVIARARRPLQKMALKAHQATTWI